MSAFGGKADMNFCGNPLSPSLLEAKRTLHFALHMSANDPKRTWRSHCEMSAFDPKRTYWTSVQLKNASPVPEIVSPNPASAPTVRTSCHFGLPGSFLVL